MQLIRKANQEEIGTFSKEVKLIISKARIAIGAIWKSLVISKCTSWKAANKLFDSVTRSILFYGISIWEIRYLKEVEKVQTEFFKRLLNIPKNTPGYMIRIEVDRVNLEYEIIKRILNYWLRILNMKDKRFPKRCLEKLMSMDTRIPDPERNWFTQVRTILEK
ncbi:uncharacterized protein LOC143151606 [Ptiloglossa arizonensis]|uniref:uncharacterized protein LOC143151606 n=1 Tax=Ptiloglossa arizonensis TaxID=3350558 RepID=UPI003FA0E97C